MGAVCGFPADSSSHIIRNGRIQHNKPTWLSPPDHALPFSAKLFATNSLLFVSATFLDKHRSGSAADGTNPVIGQFFKRRARFNSGIGVTLFGIINIAASCAYILLHRGFS
jgi:hypothetical protein